MAGPWDRPSLEGRLAEAAGNAGSWKKRISGHILRQFVEKPNVGLLVEHLRRLEPPKFVLEAPTRIRLKPPAAPIWRWQVPPLATTAALAVWFGLNPEGLDWYADLDGRNSKAKDARLRHYRSRFIAKSGGRCRLLEIPKPTLKAIQSRILHHIIDVIPPHDAAHGFRPGRSILSYARPHVGKLIVIRFDLKDFFPSVPAARVVNLFRSAGYPREVTRRLGGLCTTRLPSDEWRPELSQRFRDRHLPQGSPTSPALANLCARRLDLRLTGLAAKLGATYTRYADDLAFSGDERLAKSARRFQVAVGRIALDEGFELNYRKSRFMRRSLRQQLCGIVVNERPNLPRAEYDTLKAILTNCVRHGPTGQNRDGRADFCGHLRGRVAFVGQINPRRGDKLRAVFDRIDWGS